MKRSMKVKYDGRYFVAHFDPPKMKTDSSGTVYGIESSHFTVSGSGQYVTLEFQFVDGIEPEFAITVERV